MPNDDYESSRSRKQKRIGLEQSEIAALRDLCRVQRRTGASPYNQSIMTRLAKRGFVESRGVRNKMPVYELTELGRSTLIVLDSQMNGRRVVEPLVRRPRPKGGLGRLREWLSRLF